MPFLPITITNAGVQAINEAIGAGQQVLITGAQGGSGWGSSNPAALTALITYVMNGNPTSANADVNYQTTIRVAFSSANAPIEFQLNEIGIIAQVGSTGPPILFAYTSTNAGNGDTITPSDPASAVERDYALVISYTQGDPVSTTITLTPAIQLHAATHHGTGTDPIGIANSSTDGLLAKTPGNAGQVALGTSPQTWGPTPLHGPTHTDIGRDPVPLAANGNTGLCPRLTGNPQQVLSGDGSWQWSIPSGVIMDFGGPAAPPGWLLCNGASLPVASYPNLYGAIGYTWGGSGANFNLPDCRGRTRIGAGQGPGLTNRLLGTIGGEESHIPGVAEMPAHTHGINEAAHTHTITDPGHDHTLSQTPHAHGVNDLGHVHGVSDPSHAHGVADPGHTHAGSNITFLQSTPLTGGSAGTHIVWMRQPQPDNSTLIINVAGALTGIGIYPALTGIGIQTGYAQINMAGANANLSLAAAKTGITNVAAKTGITTQSAGGTALGSNVMQPYLAPNAIIKT
jgi:microcystin-dependent protein